MNIQNLLNAIEPGSLLIVHASFKPCKAAGLHPEDVIHALLERLGPEGTLMMPTFSYCYLNHPRKAVFDPDVTPGVLNGILSETFRTMPGVVRSHNPTFSVAVYGKYASALTIGSLDKAGLGHGSSYENALKLGAKILLLNVGNNRNSMLHYAEVASGVPYNDIPFRESWGKDALTIHGVMELPPVFPACSEEFGKFDDVFVKEGIAQKIEGSFLLDASAMVTFVCDEIRRQPDVMLCHNPQCEPCVRRRKRLQEKGLI